MPMRKKHSIKSWLLLLFIALGVGYAVLMSNIGTSGIARVSGNQWNVYLDHLVVNANSVSGNQVTEAAHIVGDTSIQFEVTLNVPEEYYIFTVDVVNDGSLDAMIGELGFEMDGEEIEYLTIYGFYSDGIPLEEKQLLRAHTSDTIMFIVGFDEIDNDDLSSTAQSRSFLLTLTYVQADNTAEEVRTGFSEEKYYVNGFNATFSREISEAGQSYNNYSDAVTSWGYPFFIKGTVNRNHILDASLGFVYKNQVYYLSKSYSNNKNLLLSLFDNCETSDNIEGGFTSCYVSDDDYAIFLSEGDGAAFIMKDNKQCALGVAYYPVEIFVAYCR